MKDKKMLTLAFLIIVKETAKKIKKFIEASSIKSIESAIKDTDLMLTDEKEWQEIQMTEDSLSKDSKTSGHHNKNNGKNAEL